MTKYQAPSPPYVGPPAKHSGRGNKPIHRIVIHSTVSDCKPGGARAIGAYFRSKTAGGSAHYIVDPGEVVQSAYDSVVAWHAPPNPHSLGIEMCDRPEGLPGAEGGSRWKRLRRSWRWIKPNQMRMLNRTAKLTAELCLAYGVPVVWLSPAQLRAGRRGITSHANVSQAWRQSTHWDPGYWPRYGFMARVRAHVKKLQKAEKKTEKKAPKGATRRLYSKNVKGSRARTKAGAAALEADLRHYTRDNPLVVALQEVPGAEKVIRKVMGGRYKRVGKANTPTRLYVYRTAKVRRPGHVSFNTPWRGPKGGGHRGRKWPAGLIEYGGKLINVLDIHQVWSRSKNRAAWNEGLRKVEEYVKSHPQVEHVIPGDWNMKHTHPDAKALAKRLGGQIIRTDADVCWMLYVPAQPKSKHRRPLKFVVRKTPRNGSDHFGFRIRGI